MAKLQWMCWVIQRFAILAGMVIGLCLIVTVVPDIVLTEMLIAQNLEVRRQSIEANAIRIEELQRRAQIADDRYAEMRKKDEEQSLAIATVQADLKTIFELGKIVLAAAIIFIVQTIGTGIMWATGKAKKV